jgi:hypothetical protein
LKAAGSFSAFARGTFSNPLPALEKQTKIRFVIQKRSDLQVNVRLWRENNGSKRFTWSAVGWMVKRHLAVLKPLREVFHGDPGAK